MKLLPSSLVLLLVLPSPSPAQTRRQSTVAASPVETYEAVEIDRKGNVHIVTTDRRNIIVPKQAEQSAFREPIISADRTAVGAQADFPNCCTSYDVPLTLVVYARGRVHRFTGIGLPIFQWHFADGGTRVAFGQQPVHFGCSVHFELRDIESERLIDSIDIPQPCSQNPNPPAVTIPSWVGELQAAQSLKPKA